MTKLRIDTTIHGPGVIRENPQFVTKTRWARSFHVRMEERVGDQQVCTFEGEDAEGNRLREIITASFSTGQPIRFEHEIQPLPPEPEPKSLSIYEIGDPPGVEPPCKKTGGNCDWAWDDHSNDLECLNCYRFRNYDLKERDEGQEPQAGAGDREGSGAGHQAGGEAGDHPVRGEGAAVLDEGADRPGAERPAASSDRGGLPEGAGAASGGDGGATEAEDRRLLARTRSLTHLKEFIRGTLDRGVMEKHPAYTPARLKHVIKGMLDTIIEQEMTDEPKFDIKVTQKPEDPDTFVIDVCAGNQRAVDVLRWLKFMNPDAFGRPDSSLIHLVVDTAEQQEDLMEKNGNTFVPGDTVTSSKGDKTASARGAGKIKDSVSEDGRMKVAWQDGTETFEKPDDLNRG